ncbi:hypothetical protein ACQ5SK_01395 [Bradyrhizobium japonicum]
MNIRDSLLAVLIAFSVVATGTTESAAAEAKDQITILYDAFGTNDAMTKDWGFSALVEVAGNASCSTRVTTPRSSPQT